MEREAAMITVSGSSAYCFKTLNPIPRDAPTINTTLPRPSGILRRKRLLGSTPLAMDNGSTIDIVNMSDAIAAIIDAMDINTFWIA